MEEWKEVRIADKYEVSNHGTIRTKNSGLIRKQYIDKNGYAKVNMYICNGYYRTVSVHRLVADAFVTPVEGKYHVDHINGVKNDNRVENLRWCTSRENVAFYFYANPDKMFDRNRVLTAEEIAIKKEKARSRYLQKRAPLETAEAKALRLKQISIEKGTKVIVNGQEYSSISMASKMIADETGKKKLTIQKEIRNYVSGLRKPWAMYGKYTIGY